MKNTMPRGGQRDFWIDNIKVFACMLVTLGHFFQSMVKSRIIPESSVYLYFNTTIYYFHVPLFFICSGFLFQKYSRVDSILSWKKQMTRKALVLGVPYLAFSTVTWILKKAFSGIVNDEISASLLHTLLLSPTAPYWYLYCLFFVFAVTPTFRTKRMAGIGLGIAVTAKLLSMSGIQIGIYAVSTVLANEIWFVLGMCLAMAEHGGKSGRIHRAIPVLAAVLFLGLSICAKPLGISFFGFDFLMGLLACTAVTGLAACRQNRKPGKVMGFFARYTLPIFLLHTLCSAPIRVALMKCGMTQPAVHVFFGITASIVGPIAAAALMSRVPALNFLLYPGRRGKSKTA